MNIRNPFLLGLWKKRTLLLPIVLGGFMLAVALELYLAALEKGPVAIEAVSPLLAYTIVLIALQMLTYGMLLLRTSYMDFRNTLDEEKSVFVRMAADAMRTPLTGMRWMTELLLGEDLGMMNEKQRRSIAKMSTAIERLIQLVNELLKIMKLSGGLIHYDARPVNAKDILSGPLETVEALANAKSQKLTVEVPPKDIQIDADLPLLRHVLQVLLSNASHLAPNESVIAVVMRADDRDVSYAISFESDHFTLRSIDKDISDIETMAGGEEDEEGPNLSVSREILQAAKGSLRILNSGNNHMFSVSIPLHFFPVPENKFHERSLEKQLSQ
jgi:signal transduction histidine kinase